MKAQVLALVLVPLMSTVQISQAGEVKKIAKIATIAYLVHKHLNPKGPTAYHVSEPHSRSVKHEIAVDPSALFNKLLRKTELVVSKMVLAQRLLNTLLRLLKIADTLPPERVIPMMAVIREDARVTDKAVESMGANLTQLLGLVQTPSGDIDVQKISQLLKVLQPKENASPASSTADKSMKSSLLPETNWVSDHHRHNHEHYHVQAFDVHQQHPPPNAGSLTPLPGLRAAGPPLSSSLGPSGIDYAEIAAVAGAAHSLHTNSIRNDEWW